MKAPITSRSILSKNRLAFLLLGLAFSLSCLAQPGNPDNPAPFGFIEVLALSGLAYGGKKAYERVKERME